VLGFPIFRSLMGGWYSKYVTNGFMVVCGFLVQ